MPLDDRREWYRYHHLFRELLRLELGQREPGLVPVLHRRAAAWHGTAGQLDEAIGQASAAGDFAEAGALIARHLAHPLGRWTTSDRGPLAGRARGGDHGQSAGGLRRRLDPRAGGASRQDTERWLAAAEDGYAGPPPDGIPSLAFGAALARATMVFDDVGRSVARPPGRRGRRPGADTVLLDGPGGARPLPVPGGAAGRGTVAARGADRPRAGIGQPYAVTSALAVLALVAADQDPGAAASLARRAVAVVDAHGLALAPLGGIVYLALGRALEGHGELAEAEVQLGRALELLRTDSMGVHRAAALLGLASVHRGPAGRPGADRAGP